MNRSPCLGLLFNVERHRRLKARERETVVSPAIERAREVDRFGITRLGKLRDDGATGIAQAQRLGHLVEGLAHGVVERLAEHLVVTPRLDVNKHGMTTRDEREDKRRLEVGLRQQVGKQVPLQMVDAHERLVGGIGKALGKGDAHDQGTHQARALRHTHGGKLAGGNGSALKAKRCRGILERRIHDAYDDLNVLARGNLGHYAAKAGVEINLRRHLVGQHVAVRIDNRHRRLIARALDGKHQTTAPDFGTLLNGALGRGQRPYALLRRRRLGRGVVDRKHQGQWRHHDDGILAGTVVPATATCLGKAQSGVERNRTLVAVLDLKRCRRAAEHLGIVAHVRQQLASDTLATMRRIDGDIKNLNVTVHDHAAGKTQQLTVVVRHPPTTRSGNVLAQLGQEHARRPRLVSSAFKAGSL